MKLINFSALLISALLTSQVSIADPSLWTEVPLEHRRSGQTQLELMPDRYSLYQLDEEGMRNYLNTSARSVEEQEVVKTLSVPLPNREMIELVVTESSVMAPELAAKFPNIKTYKVVVVGRPAVQGVADINDLGFHVMLILENGKRLFIDPRKSANGETYYISYYDSDYRPEGKERPQCTTDTSANYRFSPVQDLYHKPTVYQRSGENLRTYRLAMAATGEYTSFHGGTVNAGLSAVTTTVSRVNQVYERDLAVKLELVANNDQIIFTDASSDPYSDNDNSDTLLEENQPAIDNAIGNSSYDVGHVVTFNGGGGVASFESVCFDSFKAQAMTGHTNPANDPFDIDYVAHELGHQFGGSHSFNATDGGCNRNSISPWEIGNGVTIMGYAGVCNSSNDVSSNSIAMFHVGNIRQMGTFIESSSLGGACGTQTTLSNQQPTANGGSDYTIPAETPFQLTGTGSDSDSSDTLSYTWEQLDSGTAANISDGDLGNNPLFRVFLPTSINSRTFPQISDILNNTQTTGEILPTTSRDMNFVFTVRDQNGGVADDDVKVTVVKTSSPFKVTSHTSSATIEAGSSVDISWDVGGTDSSPISCTDIDILMSIDGGNNFAYYLAQQIDNDGSETVIVPASIASNSSTRFKVACYNNIFFDISDANLTLSSSVSNQSQTSFNESSSNHVNYFKLGLTGALSVDASVSFETRDGTAKAGDDYIATSGSATIVAGETETLIGVTIIGDSVAESDETFDLVISSPINGSFPNSALEVSATHTILNDD